MIVDISTKAIISLITNLSGFDMAALVDTTLGVQVLPASLKGSSPPSDILKKNAIS